jgi:hypothetical protein
MTGNSDPEPEDDPALIIGRLGGYWMRVFSLSRPDVLHGSTEWLTAIALLYPLPVLALDGGFAMIIPPIMIHIAIAIQKAAKTRANALRAPMVFPREEFVLA